MDKKKLEALLGSIMHWEDNAVAVSPSGASISSQDCDLCYIYIFTNCVGCPIADKTGFTYCRDTPYKDASIAINEWEKTVFDLVVKKGIVLTAEQIAALGEDFRKAAKAEVEFLKGLLPPTP